jgi:hypothetical protein
MKKGKVSFGVLSEPAKENAQIVPILGHKNFLLNLFQFIIN